MTRSVRDAAVLLGALTGIDPRDSATEQSRSKSERDYAILGSKRAPWRAHRSGSKVFPIRRTHQKLIEGALEAMKHAGAV